LIAPRKTVAIMGGSGGVTFEDAMRQEVRSALTAARMKQTTMADQLGVTQSHISRVLNGRSGLSPVLYEQMLAACGRRPIAATAAL
jgi:hypothetical protein